MSNKKLEDAYWKAVCETDAAWEEYCRHPTDDLYKEWEKTAQREIDCLSLFSPGEAARIREEQEG